MGVFEQHDAFLVHVLRSPLVPARSKRHDFDTAHLAEERQRMLMTLAPADWAAEWIRPIMPNFKMIGPLLPEPGKALDYELEVCSH